MDKYEKSTNARNQQLAEKNTVDNLQDYDSSDLPNSPDVCSVPMDVSGDAITMNMIFKLIKLHSMEVAMDTLRGGTLTPKVELAKRSATLDAMETGTTLHPSRNAWPLVSMTMTTACMFKIMGPNLLIGANPDKTCMTTQLSFLMMPGSKIFKAGPS